MKKQFLLLPFIAFSIHLSAQLVYKDVAGIFYSRCTSCHHKNGGAPFSLMNYSETSPFASSIQSAIQSGKMPPWSPDTSYTRFLHERTLTVSEKNNIISWITNGAQQGDTTLAPNPPVYSTKYKLKGKPDLIIKIPAFPSNGAGNDAYNCFSLPTGLAQDRIVRAFEVVPSNPAIVHHVVVKVDSTGTIASNTSGSCFSQPGQFDLDVYAPGGAPTVFPGKSPLKMGVRIKNGSNIILQVHYPSGTAGLIDSTEMRIYFYPLNETGIRPVKIATPLQNWLMNIPANTTTTFGAQVNIPSAVSVFGCFPHSHLLCKTMLNYANNGVDTVKLIRINNWDFEWQGFYTFPKLVKIPAGHTLKSLHLFDNTTANPNNPNSPPKTVTAGEGTDDEMLFDSFQWIDYQPGDELIDIANLLATDSLLTSTAQAFDAYKHETQAYIFPNPLNDQATLWLEGFSFNSQKPILRIYNVLGSDMHTQQLSSDKENLSLGELPDGVYFYSVTDGINTTSGKFLVFQR
jgi:hypothetical protein